MACKEWNGITEDGFDFTGSPTTTPPRWGTPPGAMSSSSRARRQPGIGGNAAEQVSWEFSSDVCKHCENAGCLEACPTGSLVRTEFGGVYLQPDICNGCGYCVVSCPFGVVQKNEDDGRAFKCTFCSDRQKAGLEPACAKACPTESIKFGRLERPAGRSRRAACTFCMARGMDDAQI